MRTIINYFLADVSLQPAGLPFIIAFTRKRYTLIAKNYPGLSAHSERSERGEVWGNMGKTCGKGRRIAQVPIEAPTDS